jgi:hypothetical protein
MLSDNKKKKRIAFKNLEKNYQGRQTSAKSENLLLKFKDFQQFSTLIIFLLNYCRKAIPNVLLAGLFSFSDFSTFFGQKCPISGEECRGQRLSKLQNI